MRPAKPPPPPAAVSYDVEDMIHENAVGRDSGGEGLAATGPADKAGAGGSGSSSKRRIRNKVQQLQQTVPFQAPASRAAGTPDLDKRRSGEGSSRAGGAAGGGTGAATAASSSVRRSKATWTVRRRGKLLRLVEGEELGAGGFARCVLATERLGAPAASSSATTAAGAAGGAAKFAV